MSAKLGPQQRIEAEAIIDCIVRDEDSLREFVYGAIAAASEKQSHFVAPRPLSEDLAEVLTEYDLITAKADRGDPEWDFVMRAADYRVIREFFAKLKPAGEPTVIENPPRPA
jgi:hypothetical protein